VAAGDATGEADGEGDAWAWPLWAAAGREAARAKRTAPTVRAAGGRRMPRRLSPPWWPIKDDQAAAERARDGHNQPQVRLDHPAARQLVAGGDALRQLDLLEPTQQRVPRDVGQVQP